MWWLLILILIVLALAVVALLTERRRNAMGGDAREDRFENPNRVKSGTEKMGEHGSPGGGG